MLCCCGLFLVEYIDDNRIKIQYRPYQYRQRLVTAHANQRVKAQEHAIALIQSRCKEKVLRLRKQRFFKALDDTTHSADRIDIMLDTIHENNKQITENDAL